MGCEFSKLVGSLDSPRLRGNFKTRNRENRVRADAAVYQLANLNNTSSPVNIPKVDVPKLDDKKLKEEENEKQAEDLRRIELSDALKQKYFKGGDERRRQQTLLQNLVHEEYRKTITEVYEIGNGKQLGSGGFGTVQIVTRHATGKEFALKTVELDRVKDKKSFDFFIKEIEIMKNLDHPNIVRLQEVFHTPSYLFMIMDLCTGGNLLQSYKFKTEKAAANIIRCIVNAIRYCHDRGIAHRDLKLDNIVYEHNGSDAVVKLVDFGLSCYTSDYTLEHDVVGTWVCMAPEVIKGHHNPCACDMWSIGVIAYLLLCGYPPFTGQDKEKLKWQITHGTYKFHESSWGKISLLAKSFITRLLVRNPQERMTAAEAQHHPWLSNDIKGIDSPLPAEVAKSIIKFRDASLLKKLALKTVARAMEADQVLLLEREFEKADTRNAGLITMSDLKQLLKRSFVAHGISHEGHVGQRRSITFRRSSISQDHLLSIFNALNVDHSGSLSLNDFIAASMSRRALDERRLRLAFDRLDFDHNGYISVDDLELVVGTGADHDELKKAISEFDSTGDGLITFEEFSAAMRCAEEVGVLDMATMHRKSLNIQLKNITRNDMRTLVEETTEDKNDSEESNEKRNNTLLDHLSNISTDDTETKETESETHDEVHRASILRSAVLLKDAVHYNGNRKGEQEANAPECSAPNKAVPIASRVIKSLFNTKLPGPLSPKR
mmetsp:Transcript_16678/g.23614  ORF Transcript_16678/g.23614 Transcript_16678/m.23614 type:complete len:718 (-) Transcript_16678:3-2156(-)